MIFRREIYQAGLDPTQDSEQAGRRPVLIVSRDAINRSSPVVTIVPITKFIPEKRIYPSQHLIKASDKNGLAQDSIVKCEQVRAIAKSRLFLRWGSLGKVDMDKVDAALKIVLSLK